MVSTNRLRIALIVLAVGAAALAVGARLYQLQILRSEGLRARAEHQHRSLLEIPANRGAIVDRHGEPLALSVEARSLYAHPRRVEDPERIAALLAPVIGVPQSELLSKLRSDRSFVYLKRLLDSDIAAQVERLDLPLGAAQALGFEHEPKRVYPHGRLAAHVVGFANLDGDGVEGIESLYDADLTGDPTIYLVLQDARNGRLRERISEPLKLPNDVVLTLDVALQHIVERELDAAMRETRARAATVVLLDPRNGDVLALASRPAANLADYGESSEAERYNRATVTVYEPGSTFKIVTMAAALDLGRVRTDQAIFCENGAYSSRGRTIHDISPQGMLTPAQIIEKSSNIGMVKIAQTLERAEFYGAIRAFGFGDRTGIELPGESPGLLAEPPRWSGFTQASLAFGQEIGVTALQMAGALGAIAAGGELHPPHVVIGRRGANGRLVPEPRPAAKRAISARTARQVATMLERSVESGTGKRGQVPGYRVGGKSGTAQRASPATAGYSSDEYVASFVGFGPLESPRLVCLVVLDTPRGEEHQGGQVAAPVFGRIMSEAFRHLRIPSSDPTAPRVTFADETLLVAQPAPRRAPTATDPALAPDLYGLSLREAVATLAGAGFRARVHGSGFVVEQHPAAGEPLAPGETCELRLDVRLPDVPLEVQSAAPGRSAS